MCISCGEEFQFSKLRSVLGDFSDFWLWVACWPLISVFVGERCCHSEGPFASCVSLLVFALSDERVLLVEETHSVAFRIAPSSNRARVLLSPILVLRYANCYSVGF